MHYWDKTKVSKIQEQKDLIVKMGAKSDIDTKEIVGKLDQKIWYAIIEEIRHYGGLLTKTIDCNTELEKILGISSYFIDSYMIAETTDVRVYRLSIADKHSGNSNQYILGVPKIPHPSTKDLIIYDNINHRTKDSVHIYDMIDIKPLEVILDDFVMQDDLFTDELSELFLNSKGQHDSDIYNFISENLETRNLKIKNNLYDDLRWELLDEGELNSGNSLGHMIVNYHTAVGGSKDISIYYVKGYFVGVDRNDFNNLTFYAAHPQGIVNEYDLVDITSKTPKIKGVII